MRKHEFKSPYGNTEGGAGCSGFADFDLGRILALGHIFRFRRFKVVGMHKLPDQIQVRWNGI